jgi:hypothetical protein
VGLMDKAKEAALKSKETAQHLAQQGQAKVASVQQSREEAELLRTLGEAYYDEQRKGGAHDPVATALAALDTHFASVAAAEASAPPASPAPPATPSAPSGDFSLDDV